MPRIALPAALLATAVFALPAAASAAANPNAASGVCPLKQSGITGGKLTVGVNIDNGKSTAADKATCAQVAKVVSGLVKAGAESPMKVNGYRCTPSITGKRVSWKCVYRGGKPRTKVTLLFAYTYAS